MPAQEAAQEGNEESDHGAESAEAQYSAQKRAQTPCSGARHPRGRGVDGGPDEGFVKVFNH